MLKNHNLLAHNFPHSPDKEGICWEQGYPPLQRLSRQPRRKRPLGAQAQAGQGRGHREGAF